MDDWEPDDAYPPGVQVPPRRKRIRLPRQEYEVPGRPFFITICAQYRRPLFADRKYANLTFGLLLEGHLATKAELTVVCLMPDHLHLLIAPTERNLLPLLGAWKSFTTKVLHDAGVHGKVWQRSFYDHAVREGDGDVSAYTLGNPVRAGVIEDSGAYPYAWSAWGPL
jgi:putative transposase